MASIKSLEVIVNKWKTVTPGRTEDYRTGVQNPRRRWSEATTAAADAWQAGVQAAIANGTWTAGVTRAGDQKWQNGCINVGAQRWAQGVSAAADAYRQGFAPYHQVIQGVELPPRGAKGDPRNINRVAAIAQALHNAKVQRAAGR
ncbi:MAG: hypothetical protein QXO46_08320 [Nitrososphaerota archaeon]